MTTHGIISVDMPYTARMCHTVCCNIVIKLQHVTAYGPVVRSALMADFAATLERMVLDYDGDADPLRPRANGAGLEGGVAFAPEPLHGLNDDDPTAFSPRELEVLLEVERGISNKQIGQALGMTEHTVKFHLKNIFRKLAVSRRTEALKVARELRVI